jgi:hypothetical protein
MNVNIFWSFLLCPLQEVASQVLDPEELQVGYSTESDAQQISTVWKVGDVEDVGNAPPARPSSQKRVACEVLGLSDLATRLHVSLPCCYWCAYGALMVHLWCTYGTLVLICLQILVIQIWSLSWHGQWFPCHMHEQKDPAKMISWRAMRMKHLMHDVIFVVFAALDFDIVGSSCFPNTDSKDPSW